MDKQDLLIQYDKFISQLRVEVDQTFWLYNFFFAISSALLGTVSVQKLEGWYLPIAIIAGLALSIYWHYIMQWKNDWRKRWLDRIKEIENEENLNIPEKFRMWPNVIWPRQGLWKSLFWLPKVFICIWIVTLIIYLVANSCFI